MYLVSVGEIFLKGKNRTLFQNRLKNNITQALNLKKGELKDLRNRFIIYKKNVENLKYVFGIHFYAKCFECSHDKINETALQLVEKEKNFRITTKRSYKKFPKTSQEIDKDVGAYIVNKTKLPVKLKNPELEIIIEILKDKAYLYKEKIKGLGGLPVGVTGTVYLQVKDEIKSTVAGFLMLKRGCIINLPKDLPLLHKFEHGFKIGNEKVERIVTDETLEDIKPEEKITKLILKPLLGYEEKEIKDLYEKIKKT